MAGLLTGIVLFFLVLNLVTKNWSGSSFNFVGDWRGFRDIKALPGEDPTILRQLSKLDLTVRPNGTFELVESGMPYEGKSRESGGTLYLRIETVMGKPVESEPAYKKVGEIELELKPLENGRLQFTDPAGFEKKPVVMERTKFGG